MSYFGGKGGDGVYQSIINNIPAHRTYIEPFLGAGSIFNHKRLATYNILLDIDADVIAKFRTKHTLDERHYIIIINENAFDYFEREYVKKLYLKSKNVFMYLDPPYLKSTRTSNHRYRYEMNETGHLRLLNLICLAKCNIAISCYPNDLYHSMLPHWRRIEYTSVTRAGEQRIEHLYMNYPAHFILHDFSYLGADCNKRQDIRRRITRNFKNIKSWDKNERLALLSQLIPELSDQEKEFLQNRCFCHSSMQNMLDIDRVNVPTPGDNSNNAYSSGSVGV